MIAVIVFGLSAAILIGFGLLVASFVEVAFHDPSRWQRERDTADVSAALKRIESLKVDPRQESSPTFGQLTEQGCFDFWLERRRTMR